MDRLASTAGGQAANIRPASQGCGTRRETVVLEKKRLSVEDIEAQAAFEVFLPDQEMLSLTV